jgi:SAM-dependent methyltransferase
MREGQDAYGQAMLDFFKGLGGYEVVERDDGHIGIGAGPELYFSEYESWREPERLAMKYVRGRVLDLGCGAGRFMLWLQDKGFEVVGIDNSPGAIEVCRLRGLSNVQVLSIGKVSKKLGTFDTLLLLGGNLGLLGAPDSARRNLRRLADICSSGGVLLGASRDRTLSNDPEMRAYVERNLMQGRLSGQSRIRIRYKRLATPYFDFFRITPDELRTLIEGTGWILSDVLRGPDTLFVAVLERQG